MRRILKWIALGAATLLVVLTVLLLTLPLLLDSEWIKASALRHLSRATGGEWRVAHLELAWLPAPTINIEGASFSIPGAAEGKVQALTLSTALFPLLWGDVRLSKVALVAPDITVIAAPTPASTGPPGTFTVSDLRAALASISRLKAVDLRSLELTIERGRFVLSVPNQTSLTLSEIKGRAALPSGRLEVEVTTASDVSHRIEAKVSLDPERFAGSIELNAAGIDLATLLAVAGVEGDPPVQGLVSLRAQIKADDSPALRGTFEATSNTLSVSSGHSKLDIHTLTTAGEAQWTDSGLLITAQEIRAAAPLLQAAAVLTFSPDWNQQRLEVKLQPADLETVKQLVLPWTTDTPEVEQYAGMITSGQLSGLEATLQLDQIEQWTKAIEVHGTVSGMAMALKELDLPIRDLSATLALVQGKLSAQGVKAASGSSAVHDGRIDLDFNPMETVVAATTQWQADLAQVLSLVRRQLAPRDRAKLDVLRDLTGDAHGTVALDGTFDHLRMRAGVDAIRAQASLEPLPWPIKVTAAKVQYDGSELVVQGLAGTLGESGFSQCTGQITLAESRLQLSSCDADLALVELFDWAAKRFRLPDAAKDLRVLAGRGLVQARSVTGPLTDPAKWAGDINVTPKAVRLTYPQLPGELALDGGSIRGNLGALTVQGVKAGVLDTALRVSGNVSDLREGKPRLDVEATGAVGEKLLAWAWQRAGIEHAAARIAPFEARPVALRWAADSGFETRGDLLFAGKTTVGFDALIQPGKLDVRKLTVQDESSNAQSSIRWQQGVLEGSFSGNLTGTSLIRIRQSKQSPDARVSGNLTYRVPIKQPRDFRANGQLRINQVTSPIWIKEPDVTLRSVELTAAARSLRLTTSFTLRDTDFDVSGTIRGTDQRYALDLDVKSDSVDVDRLLGARTPEDKHGSKDGQSPKDELSSKEHPMSWNFPVEGKVRLAFQSMRREPYRVEPLIAAVDIAPERINLAVKQAKLCGIGITGGGHAQPGTVSIDVVLRARDLDARPALLCLTKENAIVTGSLNADGHFTGSGPFRELPQRISGNFQGVARNGRVDRLGRLAQILDLVNASELLRGDKLSLSGTGFAYDRLEAIGRLEKGVVQFDAVVLDAQPFDMVAHGSIDWVNDTINLDVAVAPVQVLNSVVKLMPFLGYVLGGGVYAVPVGVRGKLSNPEIIPVAPTAVAGNILGMLERTLKTPFNLREALVPPAMQSRDTSTPAQLPPLPSSTPKQ